MIIDPHVHCRDEEQKDKSTIKKVLELAREQGVDMVFDMPNVARPVTTSARVRERLALVPKGMEQMFRLYVGLTGDPDQIAEAVYCHRTYSKVIGLKMFAGQSVGDMTVATTDAQRLVYQTLAKLRYRGVIAVHCEKEKYLLPDLWDPSQPISHTEARPKIAEITSVYDQLRFAAAAGFRGTVHICHITCSQSVDYVTKARAAGLKVTCGVTPHHLMWDETAMTNPDGLLLKMNPPLRDLDEVEKIQQMFRCGLIDWLESDHAPHTLESKIGPPYMSGYPSLRLYRETIECFLPSIGFSQKQIADVTYGNIVKTFADKLS